jgi:hypothetical protein
VLGERPERPPHVEGSRWVPPTCDPRSEPAGSSSADALGEVRNYVSVGVNVRHTELMQ